MRYKSIEVCPVGNPLPHHGPLLRDHRPVRTKESFEKELVGYSYEHTWESVIDAMSKTGRTSCWIVVKPLK